MLLLRGYHFNTMSPSAMSRCTLLTYPRIVAMQPEKWRRKVYCEGKVGVMQPVILHGNVQSALQILRSVMQRRSDGPRHPPSFAEQTCDTFPDLQQSGRHSCWYLYRMGGVLYLCLPRTINNPCGRRGPVSSGTGWTANNKTPDINNIL